MKYLHNLVFILLLVSLLILGACVHETMHEPSRPKFDFVVNEEQIPDFNDRPCPSLGNTWFAKDSFTTVPVVTKMAFTYGGSKLVYSTHIPYGLAPNDSLWLLDLSTGERLFLFEGYAIDVYATQGDIVVVNEVISNNIWTVNLKTREIRQLSTKGNSLTVAPDGKTLSCNVFGNPATKSSNLIINVESEEILWRGEYGTPRSSFWIDNNVALFTPSNFEDSSVYLLDLSKSPIKLEKIYSSRINMGRAELLAVDMKYTGIERKGFSFELINLEANTRTQLVKGCRAEPVGGIAFNPSDQRYYFSTGYKKLEKVGINDILFITQTWYTMNKDGQDIKRVELDFGLD